MITTPWMKGRRREEERGRTCRCSMNTGTRKFRRRLRVQWPEERRTCRCGAAPQASDRADVKATKRGTILSPAASGPTNASDGNSPVSNRTNERTPTTAERQSRPRVARLGFEQIKLEAGAQEKRLHRKLVGHRTGVPAASCRAAPLTTARLWCLVLDRRNTQPDSR